MAKVKLESSDGEVFQIGIDIACFSGTLKTMLEDLGVGEGDEEAVRLPHVHSAILRKIIQWATYHKMRGDIDGADMDVWDHAFLKVDKQTLLDLVAAANYLDIKGLFKSACKVVASRIQGTTPEEVRETWGIPGDLSPEEEQEIRTQNGLFGEEATRNDDVDMEPSD